MRIKRSDRCFPPSHPTPLSHTHLLSIFCSILLYRSFQRGNFQEVENHELTCSWAEEIEEEEEEDEESDQTPPTPPNVSKPVDDEGVEEPSEQHVNPKTKQHSQTTMASTHAEDEFDEIFSVAVYVIFLFLIVWFF